MDIKDFVLQCLAKKLFKKGNGIYGIYCTESNKIYIGQTSKIDKRCEGHKRNLKNNYHINEHLQNSWNKYGAKSFQFFTIEHCEKEENWKKEKYYIDLIPKEFLFNISPPALNGQETQKYIDEGWRRKVSEGLKGKEKSHIHKEHMSTAIRKFNSKTLMACFEEGYVSLDTKKKRRRYSMQSGHGSAGYGEILDLEIGKPLKLLLESNRSGSIYYLSTTPVRLIIQPGEPYYMRYSRVLSEHEFPKTYAR
jgi:group I intron endonuclease